jgi:hypothetical protein
MQVKQLPPSSRKIHISAYVSIFKPYYRQDIQMWPFNEKPFEIETLQAVTNTVGIDIHDFCSSSFLNNPIEHIILGP